MGAPSKSRQKKCRICGQYFETSFERYTACDRCAAKLPKCRGCHIVMGAEYGYLESIAMKLGKGSICWGCKQLLRDRGYLHPVEREYILASGKTTSHLPVELLNAWQAPVWVELQRLRRYVTTLRAGSMGARDDSALYD